MTNISYLNNRSSKEESTSKTSTSRSWITKGEQEDTYAVSDSYEEEPKDDNDATGDSVFEDEE